MDGRGKQGQYRWQTTRGRGGGTMSGVFIDGEVKDKSKDKV